MTRRLSRWNLTVLPTCDRARMSVAVSALVTILFSCAWLEIPTACAGPIPISVEVYDTEGPFDITKANWWSNANTLAVHENGTLGTWDLGVEITGSPAPNGSYTMDLDKFVTVDPLWTHFTIQLGTGLGDAFIPSTPSDGMYFHYNSVPPPKDASGYFDLDLGSSNGDLYVFVRNTKPIWTRPNGEPKPSQFWFRLTVPDDIDGVVDNTAQFTIRQGPHFDYTDVPEPATLILIGIAGLFWVGRFRVRRMRT